MFETEKIYRYDGTFDGLLTCIFKTYERNEHPLNILHIDDSTTYLFASNLIITTDSNLARRVMQGVVKKTSVEAGRSLFKAFLTEETGIEMTILRYIQKAMKSILSIEADIDDQDVLQIRKLNKKINREVAKINQEINFQTTADDLLVATIEPELHILPLLTATIQQKYSHKRFLVYDAKRKLGIYSNGNQLTEIDLLEPLINTKTGQSLSIINTILQSTHQNLNSQLTQHLNPTPPKRINQQAKHIPARYWKYLSETNQKSAYHNPIIAENGSKTFQVLPTR